jgi:alpha-glucosidase
LADTVSHSLAHLAWWQTAVVYQIYPRSFQDTDGDGVGDLEGIRRRLDYLSWLGIDAIWISPFYRSPMKDFGYDIADHCDVDPLFGTLEGFDRLLAEAHRHGIRVIVDYVPNHTSDRHPWFAASRAARDSDKRDWYIWRDGGPDGAPPNNWQSNFGGSAWTWDEATRQFYYHAFLREQPDLNWRNPAVRAAMMDVLRFWLARGVDGFRVDAVSNLVEDALLRDNPVGTIYTVGMPHTHRVFTNDRPETHQFIAEMRAVLDEAGDRVLIGETHLPVARVMAYYGAKKPGFHLPFNFLLLHVPWNAHSIEAVIDQYTILLPEGAWPNWVLGNHDEMRVASRVGGAQARVAAMLLMTLRGTPFVYYGEELGLFDTDLPDEKMRDPVAHSLDRTLGRDPQRTPMPWTGEAHGGFTAGDPWLPLGRDVAAHNVAALRADKCSILQLYRALIALRRREPALHAGTYEPAACRNEVIAYSRQAAGSILSILLNISEEEKQVPLPAPGRVILSTHLDRRDEPAGSAVTLRADEGVIVAH